MMVSERYVRRHFRLGWDVRVWRRGFSLSSDVSALLLVILAAHSIELSGWLSSNPIYFNSGLGGGTEPGPLPGFPGWVDFHAGATTQALGRLNADDWMHGIAPWWNPYVGVGMPLAGQLQSGPFFLPFVLLLQFFDGPLYLKLAMQGVAGLATLALLRQLGLARLGALTGAALYALGGNFAWFGDAPIMPAPFLPLLLFGIERARRAAAQCHVGGFCFVAIALAYLLVAGFPETAYFSGLLALAWTIFRLITDAGHRVAFAAKVASGGAIGLMIAAPSLLAFFHYLSLSWEMPRDYGHAALLPSNFAQYLFPYVLGPIHYKNQFDVWFHTGGYVGSGALFIGLAAMFQHGREPGLRRLLATWIVICIAKSADVAGITALVNAIPFVPMTMFFRYSPPTTILAVAILAALAIDDMTRPECSDARPRILAALAAYGALATASLVLALPQLRVIHTAGGSLLYSATSVCGGILLVLCLAALCLRPGQRVIVAGLVTAESIALFAVPLLSGTPKGTLDLAPVRFLQEHMGLDRMMTVGPIVPNYAAYFRLRSINFNYLPVARTWADYASAHVNPSPIPYLFNGSTPDSETQFRLIRGDVAAFTGLGVRYLVAFRGIDPYAGGTLNARIAYQDDRTIIYELPNPSPYVEADGCALAVVRAESVEGTCANSTDLIRRELFFPGWTATLNDRSIPIERQQPLFQRVSLPAGRFTLRFRYAPPHIGFAYGLFALGVAGLLGTAGVGFIQNRGTPASR